MTRDVKSVPISLLKTIMLPLFMAILYSTLTAIGGQFRLRGLRGAGNAILLVCLVLEVVFAVFLMRATVFSYMYVRERIWMAIKISIILALFFFSFKGIALPVTGMLFGDNTNIFFACPYSLKNFILNLTIAVGLVLFASILYALGRILQELRGGARQRHRGLDN